MSNGAATLHGPSDGWAEFRITPPQERLRLLQAVRDAQVPVALNLPDGSTVATTLWAVDGAAQRLNFSADTEGAALDRLVDCNEAVAVAYLEDVKLQFDLQGFVLVHGAHTRSLHSRLPGAIYRFQRRGAFRVRSSGRPDPVARLRHPSLPDMALTLRLLDVSIGGCALWLPADVPPLQAGTQLGEVQVELDLDTRFAAAATLHHVTSFGSSERSQPGVRIGCEWLALAGAAERLLQRWIARAQQRQRLLAQRQDPVE